MRKILSFLLITTLLTACNAGPAEEAEDEKLHIAASIYPWAFFAEQIGGDLVVVDTLVPVGLEPHDYDPSPDDLKSLYDADLFIYNGGNLEPWVDDIAFDLGEKDVQLFALSDYVALQPLAEGSEHEDEEEHEEDSTEYDPHIWLDPINLSIAVQSMANAFSNLDIKNADVYQANAMVLRNELEEMNESFTLELQACTGREFVTSHAAFSYLANRYGLTMIPISGISPEDEPTLKELEAISELVEEHGITMIYTETLIDSSFAITISTETGAQVLVLNPLEGLTTEEVAAGENFFTIFEKNLENLKVGLSCDEAL